VDEFGLEDQVNEVGKGEQPRSSSDYDDAARRSGF